MKKKTVASDQNVNLTKIKKIIRSDQIVPIFKD